VDAECDKLGRRPSSYVNGMFITLSVKLCLPHDAREAARRAGPSTTADTSSLSPVNEYSVQGHFTDVGLTEARSLKQYQQRHYCQQLIAPGTARRYAPPMAVRLAADLRPSADGSAVRTWLSCRQPAYL